jgi:hypothetical protein
MKKVKAPKPMIKGSQKPPDLEKGVAPTPASSAKREKRLTGKRIG